MNVNDIVKFKTNSSCQAGQFCHQRGITGRIISKDSHNLIVDAGLCYRICVSNDEVDLVARAIEIPDPEDELS